MENFIPKYAIKNINTSKTLKKENNRGKILWLLLEIKHLAQTSIQYNMKNQLYTLHLQLLNRKHIKVFNVIYNKHFHILFG